MNYMNQMLRNQNNIVQYKIYLQYASNGYMIQKFKNQTDSLKRVTQYNVKHFDNLGSIEVKMSMQSDPVRNRKTNHIVMKKW